MAMTDGEKRELVSAVATIVARYHEQRDAQLRSEINEQLGAVYNEIERILSHVVEVRTEVDRALDTIMTQVFNDAYQGEVMGHYRRFLVAECKRVGIGVGEYAKVSRAVDVAASGDEVNGDGSDEVAATGDGTQDVG
jgi:hypothetical protein